MLRTRFRANAKDPRPIKWPVKHPYWVTGFSLGSGEDRDAYSIVVSYADNEDYILGLWPEATHLDSVEVDSYTFTDRFPKPDWFHND